MSNNPPEKGWPESSSTVIQPDSTSLGRVVHFFRLSRNNDAERALRPVVVDRKVTRGALSDWGARVRSSNVQLFRNCSVARWGSDRATLSVTVFSRSQSSGFTV